MTGVQTTPISPPDHQLHCVILELRSSQPSLSLPKLLQQLRCDHPEWAVSEKRLRKAAQALMPIPDRPTVATSKDAGVIETALVAVTGLDQSIDTSELAPKVKVKMFGGDRGKGLVARSRLEKGELIWQEDPWLSTADPGMHSLLLSQRMCTQCLTVFPRPNPPMSVPCSHCDSAHFCNRLCSSRARSSASHHDLLCPGQNPAALEILNFIHRQGARHLECVIRLIAKWRGERDWGDRGKAKEMEDRVWRGMARVSMEKKDMEQREWELIGELRQREWRNSHELLCRTLNPKLGEPNHKLFHKLLARRAKQERPTPLTLEEEERWFSYDGFLQLLGLASLNQEGSGGLYALHAHLNHSCEPNLQVRNLPKSYTLPDGLALPCDLPPPNPDGVRGTNRLSMLARRTIHPGEEITIPYVNPKMSRRDRRRALRIGYGFWCSCTKCERERKASEGRPSVDDEDADMQGTKELLDKVRAMAARDKTEAEGGDQDVKGAKDLLDEVAAVPAKGEADEKGSEFAQGVGRISPQPDKLAQCGQTSAEGDEAEGDTQEVDGAGGSG